MFNCAHLHGRKMQQTVNAIPAWSKVIREYKVRRTVEIGTGAGAFSVNLLCEMLEAGGDFQTWDIRPLRNTGPVAKMLKLADYFHQGDVFANESPIKKFIGQPGTSVVFCDGGNKRKELATFQPYLKKGDIIAVHDWGWAVSWEDRRKMPLQKLPECMIDPLTAFFVRV